MYNNEYNIKFHYLCVKIKNVFTLKRTFKPTFTSTLSLQVYFNLIQRIKNCVTWTETDNIKIIITAVKYTFKKYINFQIHTL